MENSEISFPHLLEEMESEYEMPEGLSEEKRVHDESLKEGEEELSKEFIAESRKRLRAVTEIDKLFDRLEETSDPASRKTIALEIENFLDKNESIIAREDKSGATEVEYYRERLNKLREKRKGVAA